MKKVNKELSRLDKQIFWAFAVGIAISVALLIATIIYAIVYFC